MIMFMYSTNSGLQLFAFRKEDMEKFKEKNPELGIVFLGPILVNQTKNGLFLNGQKLEEISDNIFAIPPEKENETMWNDERHHLEIIRKKNEIFLFHRGVEFLNINKDLEEIKIMKEMYNLIVDNHNTIDAYFQNN